MKTLIISDLHFTPYFRLKKFEELKRLFESVDQVILNGDFWDSYFCTFDDFVKSKWSELFPILKSKNTVYLFGNHDPKERCDERMNLFSNTQANEFKFEKDGKTYIVTHGHFITNDKPASGIKMKLAAYASYLELPVRMIFGNFALKLKSGGDIKVLKHHAKNNIGQNEVLVCGHTHLRESDMYNKYINSGCCRFNWVEYQII